MSDNTMKINNTGVSLSDDLEEVQEAQVIKSTVGQEIDNEIDNEPEETENEDVDIVEVDMKEPMKSKRNKRHQTVDIYHNTMITKKVSVPISNIGKNLSETLENIISSDSEGKCIAEGYVKPRSTKILTYSSGLINSDTIIFEVVMECMICCPVEGMHIDCEIKNITRAGIRAETSDAPSPVVIFVARDHSASNKYPNISEKQELTVRVIGQRFELNDKYISIIAEIINVKKKKKLTIN
tara:strand:- start:4916 stop:5632 length:717 start_codon:yes stop_codon:yes gene_type:complete